MLVSFPDLQTYAGPEKESEKHWIENKKTEAACVLFTVYKYTDNFAMLNNTRLQLPPD